MANADGQIILGLNISATAANIQSGLNSILNSTKTKQIVLKTAIEKAQTEKSIESLVSNLSKKTVKLGVEINAKDVQGILAQQQKIASTQANLNRQMQEYRKIAKDIGVTLNKNTWNSFNHAIKTEDFAKAREIIKSAKQQIDQYNNSIKKMNSDTSVSGSVSSIVEKFRQLNTVSGETKQKVSQLKAALTRFENADSEQKKLRAYESLKQRLAELTNEYQKLSSIEKTAIGNIPKTLENIASKSIELKVAVDSSGISGSGITGLSSNLDELRTRAETLQQKLSNLDPSNANDVKQLQQEVSKLDSEFKKVEKDAKIFEDVNSIATFTTNIEKAKQKVEEYGQKYSAIKSRPDLVQELERLKISANNISTPSQLKQWNAEFATFDTKVRQAGVHCKSFGDILKSAFSNFAQFFSASRIIYEVIETIKEMVSAVKELDSAMVELRKVTDAPESDFAAFFERSKQSAIDYATTMKDIINSTADFSRLGFTFKESEQLAKTASVYNTVGDIDNIEKATESIISTMKAFGVETENSMSIVDKFNEVGNNFAISSEGIGDAFTRSASSMAAANNTIDQTIALITAANSVVQDADSVGTAFKTVSMRIRGATTELEEAGLETDGMAESTAKLREEIMALSGVDIMLDENTFKSTYQIMDELSAKWAELTDIQQASITELIAGKRQGNIISSLMENFDIARDALETSLGSSGSAMKEFEIQLDSVESKSKQFKAAFEALSTSVVNSNLLKGLIDTGTTLLTVIDSLIEKLGGFGNTLTIIGLAIAALNFKGTVNLFTSIFNSLKTGFGIIPKVVSAFGNLKAAWDLGKSAGGGFITTLKGASSALIGTASAASIATAAIMAIVAVIAIAVMAYQNWKREQEEARQAAIDSANAAAESSDEITDLTNKYLQLSEEVKTNAAVKETLITTEDTLLAKLGLEGSRVDELVAKYGNLSDAIKAASVEKLQEDERDLRGGLTAKADTALEKAKPSGMAKKGMNHLITTWDKDDTEINHKALNALVDAGYISSGSFGSRGMELWLTDMDLTTIEGVISAHDQLGKMLDVVQTKAGSNNEVYKELYTRYNNCTESIQAYKDGISDLNKNLAQQYTMQGLIGKEVPKTQKEFEDYRNSVIESAKESGEFEGSAEDIANAIDIVLASNSQFTNFMKTLKSSIDNTPNIQKSIDSVKEKFKTAREEIKKEAEDLGVDLSQTVFGNIDTDNRQVLEWTDENIAKYKSAIESWGHSVEDLKGDISTVLGSSAEFDGVEIAFSPMLQTENGAVLLDKNTVYKYINSLIESAGEGWTTEDLLRLDTTGLEIDGQIIKGLLADIGETAKQTGEAMHFTGKDGAVKKAEKEIQEFNNWIDNLSDDDKELVYNISLTKDTAEMTLDDWNAELENLKTNSSALDILKAKVDAINDVANNTVSFDVTAETTGLDNLQSVIASSVSATGITSEMIAQIKGRYSDLAGFDPAELFEKTAHGVHLNADALRELESEYEAVNKTYLDTVLDEQVEKYNDLTEKISGCTDAQERAKLVSQQNKLADQIEETSILAAQYDGLTSAYQRWIDAQSGGEEGDMYDNISSGMKDVKELFDAGLVGTNEFRAAVQLMSNEDLSTAPIDKLVSAYQAGYGDMKRYFTEGQSGCIAFLSDISRLNSEWAKMNSDGSWEINFGVGNDEEIAKELGISVEAVQAIMRKLSDYGFEIDLDSVYDDLAMLEDKFVSANEKLKELGATDVDFNLNTKTIDDVTKQIETAKGVFKNFTNEDGTVNLALEGAAEAQLLLTALIQKKQELSIPAVMKVDTTNASTDVENVIKSLQEFQTSYNNLEIAAAIGLDTTEAQTNVDTALASIAESNPEILASLGIDATSAETLSATISALTPEVMVKAGIDASLVEGYQQAEHNAEGTVTWDNDTTKVDNWIVQKHNADGTVYWDNNTKNVKTHFTATGTIKWSGDVGARGTAFAQGNWGASKSGIALGGELGQELIVRNGKFFTIGDEGAEFFHYQKDDIIFNAEQTEQILEKGKISSGNRRGRALVEGTAFSSGTGRFYQSGKVVTTKYVAPTDSSTSPTPSTTPKTTTEKSDEETEFERQYKYHQHLLAMDRETVQEYLDWLVAAYKEAYNAGQMELDDFYKYEEEVYEKSKSLFDDLIKDSEHQISLWENQGGNEQNIINEYKEMQKAVHEQAEYYRSLGLSEENDKIQELQKQWWDYENAIRDTNAKIYEDIVKNSENTIALNENWLNNAAAEGDYEKVKEYSGNIINEYKEMQKAVHEQAEYYRSLGYSDTSDEVSALSDLWWDYQEAIVEAGSSGFQILVDNAHEALDEIQNVYDTLKSAAQEYGDSGFISPDTLQDILSMGVEYLAMLKNQNGQLEINERTINRVIKAKTEQLGVETALNYVERLRTALTNNDVTALNNLLDATDAATKSTWDLVYAQLATLDLTDSQFNTAVQRINTIRSLTDTAISGVGQTTNGIADGLSQTSEALQQILDYTIEVIKQETENKIENLEEQVDRYNEIVDLQKESLATTKEQSDYDDTVADKLKEISKLQNQINQLSLDDSREAQAEKKSLEEELANLQNDLSDYQADYAYDATVESLDKMAEAYEEEKNEEIEILRDSISSYQKLYDLAIQRIEDEGSSLKNTLIAWNEEYGSSLTSEITTAWNNAKKALKEYEYEYEKAVKATNTAIESSEKGDNRTVSDSSYSTSYYTNTTANSIVAQMKANSSTWGSTDDADKRSQLAEANQKLGKRLVAIGVNAVYNSGDGTWYIGSVGGTKLYDEYPKYHAGGIVGAGSLKDKEMMAVLEEGEIVLDESKKKAVQQYLELGTVFGDLSKKFVAAFGGAVSNSAANKYNEIMNKDIAQTLSQIDSDNSVNYHIDKVEVTAPIQVTEKLDKSDIEAHAKMIGEVSTAYLQERLRKKGVSSNAKLF